MKNVFALVLTFVAFWISPGYAQVDPEIIVETMSDHMTPIPGAPVGIEVLETNQLSLRVSNSHSVTEPVTVPGSSTVLLHLGETGSSQGIALGQVRTVLIPPSASSEYVSYYLQVRRNQPLLIPCVISTAEDLITATPYHMRWGILPTYKADPITVQAYVGMLLTDTEIDGYSAYYAVDFGSHSSEYRLGLVIRCNNAEIKYDNLVVVIDCRGHNFQAPPVADCFAVTSPLSTPKLWAYQTGWNGEFASYLLGGEFKRGDNILLLREGTGAGASTVLVPAPMTMTPSVSSAITNCNPDPPTEDSGWTCTPDEPSWWWGGSSAGCPPTIVGANQCTQFAAKAGPRPCGNTGQSTKFKTGRSYGGSIALKFKIRGVGVTATGHYEDVSEVEQTYTFQAGANQCGQCVQGWTTHLLCTTPYTKTVDKIWYELIEPHISHQHIDPCALEVTKYSVCEEVIDGISFTNCDVSCN